MFERFMIMMVFSHSLISLVFLYSMFESCKGHSTHASTSPSLVFKELLILSATLGFSKK